MSWTRRGALRTRVVVGLLERTGRVPIEEASTDDIAAARARVHPTRRPYTWVTGPLAPADVTDAAVPVRDGHEVPVRCYVPRGAGGPAGSSTGPRPLLVYVHGGGWVQGSTRMYDPLCTRLAAGVGAVVVSVDYRMAPEHPAPRPAQDVLDVVQALVRRGDGGTARLPAYDADRVGLAGDSAGGNLCAIAAQQLRDLPGPGGRPAIRHQALVYPATDLTLASPSIEEHRDGMILTKGSILAFRRLYLGTDPGDDRLRDPTVSPLFGDVAGVAPALVQTADLDPIRDDGLRYAALLQEAGVPVRATNYVGLPHGFASMPGACPSGWQAEAELVGEIRDHLRPAGAGPAA